MRRRRRLGRGEASSAPRSGGEVGLAARARGSGSVGAESEAQSSEETGGRDPMPMRLAARDWEKNNLKFRWGCYC
jgi:hypothetical protein